LNNNQVQVVVTQTQQPDGTVTTDVTGPPSRHISAYILGVGLNVLHDQMVNEERERLANEDGMPKVQIWTLDGPIGPN
jgi:hypothetical protein